jgi:redox-sensitive bicupin YhaK (pirin superfamily)
MNILKSSQAYSNGGGVFSLQMRRPGMIWQDFTRDDFAFGPLSRIDHARLSKGALVSMHEHTNDEILSYMWKGEMLHKDSSGQKVMISPSKHMMMGAGKSFFHEESTPNGPVEMLQIFIRPEKADLAPRVQFLDLDVKVDSQWNLIAGPKQIDAPLEIRQQVAVYDVHGKTGDILDIPKIKGMSPWLYVMDGSAEVDNNRIDKGDAITGNDDELSTVKMLEDTTLVLFLVDLNAEMTYAGNFSGIKR